MDPSRYAVVRRASDWLEVSLKGDLDAQVLLACEREVRAQIALAPPGLRAIVNLSEVRGYHLEAREQLVSMQRCIGAKAAQTAYVAEGAPGRALALWVIHTSQGQVVRSFARAAEAEQWLAEQNGDPQSGVREVQRDVLKARETATRRPRKRAAS
jgi:hypothetical protein